MYIYTYIHLYIYIYIYTYIHIYIYVFMYRSGLFPHPKESFVYRAVEPDSLILVIWHLSRVAGWGFITLIVKPGTITGIRPLQTVKNNNKWRKRAREPRSGSRAQPHCLKKLFSCLFKGLYKLLRYGVVYITPWFILQAVSFATRQLTHTEYAHPRSIVVPWRLTFAKSQHRPPFTSVPLFAPGGFVCCEPIHTHGLCPPPFDRVSLLS